MSQVPMFTVKVYENFHFMDESETYFAGSFNTYEEAELYCKRIVDEYIEGDLTGGRPVEDLNASYKMFGEDPAIIMPTTKHGDFSAWNYAAQQCDKYVRGEFPLPDGYIAKESLSMRPAMNTRSNEEQK